MFLNVLFKFVQVPVPVVWCLFTEVFPAKRVSGAPSRLENLTRRNYTDQRPGQDMPDLSRETDPLTLHRASTRRTDFHTCAKVLRPKSRSRRMCHFRKRATSTPAEFGGENHNFFQNRARAGVPLQVQKCTF